jgi:hypothetical protein
MMFSGESEVPTRHFEYSVGGCRGAIVNLEVQPLRLSGLRYEVLAPSGTTVTSEELSSYSDRVVGKAIRLPESGFYRVLLTTSAQGEQRTGCAKYAGAGKERRCIQEQSWTVYPVQFQVAFRGNAETPALKLGEQGDGTVTQREPFSRRVLAEAHGKTMVRVVASGGRVECRVEAPDGTAIPTSSTSGGCHMMFPEGARDVSYALSITSMSTDPVGISVIVEAPKERTTPLVLGKEAEGIFELNAQAIGVGQADNAVDWSIEIPVTGTYELTIVPSGLARLELEITLYNRSSEEVIFDRKHVSGRVLLPTKFPVAGQYVLRVSPVKYDVQRTQWRAKYSLLIQRSRASR